MQNLIMYKILFLQEYSTLTRLTKLVHSLALLKIQPKL
ncbi:hypothetical protein NSE_0786 [Neorickettsia sennetsu str. Miyayama]|uniref:Uncharacterized protein n=1 Tax=Ehrlichia sennetsu (strain ATCC VR-367 / Miyayama) TaxID=222891 RepID=Q2GCY5_EHRS3|nr:hypothetical protein NSE_0786 [Neorickettsia sennetsu str. Miyayama]